MSEPDHHRSAPVPIGDVVPGDPPVPITVWHVPHPAAGETMSRPLAARLVHNFTHPGDPIIDMTVGPQLGRAIMNARRQRVVPPADPAYEMPLSAALLVAAWPDRDGDPAAFFTAARSRLRDGGCLAVVLPHTAPTMHADLITAGHRAGLAYLQHIVAVTGSAGHGGHARLRVHSDVLVLIRSATREAGHG